MNSIDSAYINSEKLAKDHYENFPVLSFFVSKKLRKHVAVIYKFARDADDIADEGDKDPAERLKELDEYNQNLKDCLSKSYKTDFWFALANTIKELNLSENNFYNLLKAFKQDVNKHRYNDFNELLDYCSNSANPVGRIILELNGIRNEKAFYYSDKICSALQLANFYQDVSIDFNKGRIYIPLDECDEYQVNENQFGIKENSSNFTNLIKYQIKRTREMFNEGRNLLEMLPYKLRIQISWTINGGEAILSKIEKMNFDVLNRRPKLSKTDYFIALIKALLN
ncbi:MAG: squalene synthase HpnC [Melioribacteraceae bacterium]|nr:squalene synthase HpnC [Melioribacteraceae bacterium]